MTRDSGTIFYRQKEEDHKITPTEQAPEVVSCRHRDGDDISTSTVQEAQAVSATTRRSEPGGRLMRGVKRRVRPERVAIEQNQVRMEKILNLNQHKTDMWSNRDYQYSYLLVLTRRELEAGLKAR